MIQIPMIPLPKDYHIYPQEKLIQMSNLIFLYPILYLYSLKPKKTIYTKLLYLHLCLLFIATSYYHLNPTTTRLLPDMFAVSSLTTLSSLILLDIPEKHIISMYILSVSSLIYFHYTKNSIAHICIVGGVPAYTSFQLWNTGVNKEILEIGGYLLLSRITEHNDRNMYSLTNQMISGHLFKHILSMIMILKIIQLMERLHKI